MVAVQSKTEAISKKDYLKARSRLLTERERRFEMLEILDGEMKAGNDGRWPFSFLEDLISLKQARTEDPFEFPSASASTVY
jgi:hypothetical protein